MPGPGMNKIAPALNVSSVRTLRSRKTRFPCSIPCRIGVYQTAFTVCWKAIASFCAANCSNNWIGSQQTRPLEDRIRERDPRRLDDGPKKIGGAHPHCTFTRNPSSGALKFVLPEYAQNC
jgi:hypothetical protein